jgi:integrase
LELASDTGQAVGVTPTGPVGRRRPGRDPVAVSDRMAKAYATYCAARTADGPPPSAAATRKTAVDDSAVRSFLGWLDGPGRAGIAALEDARSAADAAREYLADLETRRYAPATVSRHAAAVAGFCDRLGLAQSKPEPGPLRRRGAAPAAVPEEMQAVHAQYARQLETVGGLLDEDTRRAYASRVRMYLIWLHEAREAGLVQGDPLAEQRAADYAVRDYRAHMLTVLGRSLETVNAHLTALGDFYRRRGMSAPNALRQDLPPTAPRALAPRQRTLLQRAAERASPRDRVLVYLGLLGGLRVGEMSRLDLDDAKVSARLGGITVRYGKGGKYRQVPMHARLRAALLEYLQARRPASDDEQALILSVHGTRMSPRGIYDAITAVARDAGLEIGEGEGQFSPHVSRHTAGTVLHRELGFDLALVAEILGQNPNTTRRYVTPTAEDRQAAIDAIPVDE